MIRSLRLPLVFVALFLLGLLAVVPAVAQSDDGGGDDTRMKASTFAGLELRGIGPALMSGRIADIDIDPRDRSTWYVAVFGKIRAAVAELVEEDLASLLARLEEAGAPRVPGSGVPEVR